MVMVKQSTSVDLVVGPLLDDTDAKTPETGLTVSQSDVRLSKNGAAFAQKNDTNAATHLENGFYKVPLNSTDTGTLGLLTLGIFEAGALPVWMTYEVVSASTWDALFGTGPLPANVTQISGDGTAADNAESFFDGTGYAGTNNVIPLVTTVTNLTNAATTGDFTATQKASITTAATSSLNTYDPPTRAELTSDVSALATASALSTVSGKVDTIDGIVDDILVDTGTTVPAQISALNNISTAQVNAEVDTALADIHLDHLFANTYDPASKPGASDALLNEMVGNDGGVSQFTANALELAPSGTGASAASIVAAMFTTDTGETEADAVAGSVVYEIVQNAGGGSGPSASDIRDALGMASANLDTQLSTIDGNVDAIKADTDAYLDASVSSRATQTSVDDVPTNTELGTAISTGLATYDGPTNAEMVARTLPTADYATSANLATVDTVVDTIAAGLIVVDGLVDTLITQLTGNRSEPSPGAPPASASLGVKVDWLYAIVRNGESVTATLQTIYADDGTTPLTKATVADDGTTFTRAELVAP